MMKKKTAIQYYQNQKIRCTLYVVEMVVLVYLLCTLFFQKTNIVIQGREMSGLAEGLEKAENNSVVFEQNGREEEIPILCSNDFALKSGAYEVVIQYDSVKNVQEPSESTWDGTGKLKIYSEENENGLIASELILDDEHSEKTSMIWVKTGYRMRDLRAEIDYTGPGKLRISSIALRERVIWRFMRLFVYLMICFFLNCICYFFSEERFFCLNGEKKERAGILACIIMFSSLLCFADFLFYGHDLDFHIGRIAALSNSIQNGQFPQRIEQSMLNGYGYATPLFYGELFLYFPAILNSLCVPLQACYQIYVIGVNIVTCLSAYFCFKKITEKEKYAILGAFLYTCSSYRLMNVYLRAAVGEYTALAFLPMVLLGIYNIYEKKKGQKMYTADWVPLVFGISGIIQSHIITTYMMTIFVVIFCIFNLKKTFEKERILALCKAGILTVLLNLWFLVPFLESMKMDIMVNQGEKINRLNASSLYLPQLFGIFHTASGANQLYSMQEEMPLSLGSALVFGMALFALCILKRRIWNLCEKKVWKTACWSFGMASIAIFFTLNICPWDMLQSYNSRLAKLIGMIQFPWRYLGVATLFLIVGMLNAFQIIEVNCGKKVIKMTVCIVVLLVLMEEGLFYKEFIDQSKNETFYAANDVNDFEIGQGEYLLSNTMIMDLGTHKVNTNPETVVRQFTEDNGHYCLNVKNKAEIMGYADIPVLAYEHYYAHDVSTKREIKIQHLDASCRIRLVLPPEYDGAIEVKFKEPLIWRICETISFLSVVGIVLYFIFIGHIRRRHLSLNGTDKEDM